MAFFENTVFTMVLCTHGNTYWEHDILQLQALKLATATKKNTEGESSDICTCKHAHTMEKETPDQIQGVCAYWPNICFATLVVLILFGNERLS